MQGSELARMARIGLQKLIPIALAGAIFGGVFAATDASARVDPNCLDQLKKDRVRILEKFGKLQNYKTYTPAKAAKLQAEVEAYLIKIGTVLENFNVEILWKNSSKKFPRSVLLRNAVENSFKKS